MLSAALSWPFSSQRTDMPPRKQTHRRASDTEEMLKQVLPGSAALAKDPEVEAEMKTAVGLSRVVDMRIPLWGVLSALAVGGFTLISMWFSVQQLTTSMQKVQVTLEAGSAQTAAFREELAVQKFRLANIDAEIAALKAARYQDSLRTPR